MKWAHFVTKPSNADRKMWSFQNIFPQQSFWKNELYPFPQKGKQRSMKPESNSKTMKRHETPQGDI